MDTSETYTKMCKRAKEIQESKVRAGVKEFEEGDYYKYSMAKTEPVVLVSSLWMRPLYSIWLPRQDQLQEMILPTLKQRYNKVWDLDKINRTANWLVDLFETAIQDNRFHSNSMEQLWLAFVMKEKYNKAWNEEDWIKES